MAVTLADIKKLRDITGAGMMDVKKALEEANGDFEQAKDLLRKRGQAIAAKRSDREASEGCVLAKAENGFGAIVAVKCETDFVAKNADFVGLVKLILDVAMANKPKSLEELSNIVLDGHTVAEFVTERSGVTGEKMELSDYVYLEAAKVDAYNHLGNKLSTLVAVEEADAQQDIVHGISMQVAAMAPIALDADHVPAEVKEHELSVAVDKTKQDEVNKAVENALRKAGINPAHVDSEDHIESNTAKGWITPEQATQAREIKATVAAEAEANINLKKVEMIAQGRLQKFLKESTLVEQIYVMSEDKALVKDVLKKANITVADFKRVTLNVE
ncbi:MAG: translation elongation factor Ts [Paludibacter sp.]|nr:translation elongation factor Ts [Bacteroidales bacterium]MCM1069494.1 translation elongation factor Ts [Prevotella sp.]MCM1354150.1 translation elongation factor Ts [Bacteroides sp.]MCM1442993.1 translation elongation factor Ts [Muribaculum sp.]MCM1482225.1 translation elongation factor Ts [Paludibacter sp.]